MNTTQNTQQALTDNQILALGAFTADEVMTAAEVAAEIGKKAPAVTSTLKALVKRELLVAVDGGYQLPAAPTTEVPAEPVESTVVLTPTLETALAAARERIAAEKPVEVVTSKHGDYVRSARAGEAWITTDGLFVCAKGTLEGTDKEPWALYRVGETLTFVGTYKTSSTPFLVATQAPFRA